jgi:hypothetical protein
MHTNAAGVTTHYVAEGDPIPTDLPDEVVFVGPGSGEKTEPEPEKPQAEAAKPKPEVKAETGKPKADKKEA